MGRAGLPTRLFFAIRALDSNGGELKVNLLDDEPASGYKVFKVMGPTEWAKSVPDPEFLIEKVLCQDTSGVNAGPKKSLKTMIIRRLHWP